MSGTAWRALFLTLVPAALCSGCGTRYPTDLSFHSAQYANLDLSTYSGLVGGPSKHFVPAVEVHFRTSADLVSLRREYSGIHARFNECDSDRQIMTPGISSIFHDRIGLNSISYDLYKIMPTPSNLNDSHFYIFIDQKENSIANEDGEIFSINLNSPPDRICFYVAGSTMLFSRFRSNEVAIPKAAIAQALRGIQIK